MDAGVKRLDPAVEDLGRAGQVADLDHGHVARAQAAAVPPVETSSTPLAASRRPSSTRPVLSCTESSADRPEGHGFGF